jgi:NTP pyrophosphatase (non-canonical NTP hydrolase)
MAHRNINEKLAKDIDDELDRAKRHGERFVNLHEAYAVLLEEVDEVWEITKQKQKVRSKKELRSELIQVAAMAIKSINSMDGPGFIGGKV